MKLREFLALDTPNPRTTISDIYGTRVRALRDNTHAEEEGLPNGPGYEAADEIKAGNTGKIIGGPTLLGIEIYWDIQWDNGEQSLSATRALEVVQDTH